MRGEPLKGHLDMLLLTLVDVGAAHGYSIVERLRTITQGTFDLADGTVYPALHRLCDAGLLKARWSEDGGRRRRLYVLTPKGKKELQRQREYWTRFERSVRSVLALKPQ